MPIPIRDRAVRGITLISSVPRAERWYVFSIKTCQGSTHRTTSTFWGNSWSPTAGVPSVRPSKRQNRKRIRGAVFQEEFRQWDRRTLKKRQGSRGKRIRRLRLDDSCFSVLSCPSFTVIDHGDGCSFLSLWAGERAPLFLHGGPRLQTGRRSIETKLIQAGIHHPDQKNRTTRPGLVPLKNTRETKKGAALSSRSPFLPFKFGAPDKI